MSDFNALKFVADNAGLNIFKALEKAYEQGKADAIPMDWIKEYLAWLESMDADVAGSDARAIKVMLTKWKMEQENAGGCSADACPIKF